jgi:hypothetical protein
MKQLSSSKTLINVTILNMSFHFLLNKLFRAEIMWTKNSNYDYIMHQPYNKQILFHTQLSTVRGRSLKVGEVSKLTNVLNE